MSKARDIGDLLNGGQTIKNIEDTVGLTVKTVNVSPASNLIDIEDEFGNPLNGFDEDGDLIRHTTFNDYGIAVNDLGSASGDITVDLSIGQSIQMDLTGDITSFTIESDPKHVAREFDLLIKSGGNYEIDWSPFSEGSPVGSPDEGYTSISTWFGANITSLLDNEYYFKFYFMDGEWYGKYVGVLKDSRLPFIMTIRTTAPDETFTLPFVGGGFNQYADYDCKVTWGDGNSDQITSYNQAEVTHTYSDAGDYQIFIVGITTQIKFLWDNPSILNLISIDAWGDTGLEILDGAFSGCTNLESVAPGDKENGGDTSNVWDLNNAFKECAGLTSFPVIDTSNVTDFSNAWEDCIGLTSFPLINTSKAVHLSNAWNGCTGLTSFPLIDTSNCEYFTGTWQGCSGLTSFPVISLNLVDPIGTVSMTNTWNGCTGLTSFPLIDTSKVTELSATWQGCSGLTSFPLIDTSRVTNFGWTWLYCTGLESFPLIDTSSGIEFDRAWGDCSALTEFPLIDTSSGEDFDVTWGNCSGLTSFPALDLSSGTTFVSGWFGCSSLISVDSGITFGGAPNFLQAWYNCSSLTTFPSGVFDTLTATGFENSFHNTSLDEASKDNVLVSIDTAGQSNGALNINGGDSPSATGDAAWTSLQGKGWTGAVT